MRMPRVCLALTIAMLIAPSAWAASLTVAPVLIDLSGPAAASSVRIHNDAQKPVNVQVRIFRWSQKNGEDVFTPATDVVASPPIATLKPGGDNMVRVVRTSKQPVQAEESYRLIVDELPDPGRRLNGTVTLVVRQSIPVFFSQSGVTNPEPAWSVAQKPGGWQISLTNNGAKRMKVSNLTLSNGKTVVARRDGLVGYVLGNSTASWFVPASASARISGRSATISADSDAGRINVTTSVKGG